MIAGPLKAYVNVVVTAAIIWQWAKEEQIIFWQCFIFWRDFDLLSKIESKGISVMQ